MKTILPYLIVGDNVFNPSVYFNVQKTAVVPYGKTFTTKPQVMPVPEDISQAPACKAVVGLSSCTIKFSLPYTGWVSLQITQRI